MNCCWKLIFGSSKKDELKEDLITNEVVSEPVLEEEVMQRGEIVEEDDDAISEVSTEIDYENDMFEDVDGDEEDGLHESQMRKSEVVESEISNNSSNATTIGRFIS